MPVRLSTGMNRRESLALAAGTAASLAGCSGFASSSPETTRASPATERTAAAGPSSGTETDPGEILVRVDTDRQPIWLADEDDGRPTPRPDARHVVSVVVDSEARAGRLSVAPEVDGTRVASFLSATDFGDETVFLETIQVEECFRLELCRISWGPEKVSTDYTRRSRRWDEPCAVGERPFESRLIRIPDAISAADIGAGSTSIGTGACRRSGTRPEASGDGGSGPSMPDDAGSDPPTGTSATTGGER